MAHCYNCGCDISEEDKTRLCDDCKKILLPFVKFMDASTSSAVRRLISNENNLRNAGVTDNGMEYLLRICELHDRKKAEENGLDEPDAEAVEEEIEAADEVDGQLRAIFEDEDDDKPKEKTAEQYTDIEVPLDKPLNLIRRSYGQYLAAAEIVLGVAAAALLVWFFIDLFVWNKVDFTAIPCCIASAVGVYIADSVRRMIHDVEELKKHFR